MRNGQAVAGGVVALAVAGALFWMLRTDPLPVDLATVSTGPMEVTVTAEGMTRVREVWSVTAPITGTVERALVQVGDRVEQDKTEVARIRPAAPALLDARSRLQAEAAVSEAQAAVRLAEVVLAQAEADSAYAEAQLRRDWDLAHRGTIPQRTLEDSQQKARAAGAALDSARYELDLHNATLARMKAQLFGADGDRSDSDLCCVALMAPHSGSVLEITDQSARLVQAGSPLLTIGDLGDLQIETDLLSADAVRVQPGALAHVERWGGDGALAARVVRIDPSGFTRVSALGIEEQRVHVYLDIVSPPDLRITLGDRYRVFVNVVLWSTPSALRVPQSALFRQGEGWAVFRSVKGHAVVTPVEIGHSEDQVAEVMSGLSEGDKVILYPGNQIADGATIVERALE